jgi:hypothetical protein
MNADRCKVSTGKYEAKVSAEKPYEEVYVGLGVMLPAKCQLTVEKLGEGIVTSSPAGVSCGASCTMEVPVGTKVTLTAATYDAIFRVVLGRMQRSKRQLRSDDDEGAEGVSAVGTRSKAQAGEGAKGSFTMGSPTGNLGAKPMRRSTLVTLTTDFWMAESEVTQRQYRNLMGSSPSYFKGDELPVESVSWFEAVEYCNALSVKEKLTPCYQISGTTVGWADGVKCSGYRLPTEAEWEYAARSPATAVYAGSDSVDGVAWYSTNSGVRRTQ